MTVFKEESDACADMEDRQWGALPIHFNGISLHFENYKKKLVSRLFCNDYKITVMPTRHCNLTEFRNNIDTL